MKVNNFIILITILLCSTGMFGQNGDPARIVIYRPSIMVGAAIKAGIVINGQNIGALPNGGTLVFDQYNTGKTKIELGGNIQGWDAATTFTISTKGGETYFYQMKGKMKFLEGYFDLWKTDEIERENKLNKKKVYKDADFEFVERQKLDAEARERNSRNNIVSVWEEEGAENYEGIYEAIGSLVDYELAFVNRTNTGPKQLVYLSGAEKFGWKEGEIKATLTETATPGLFKAAWVMLNGNINKDVLLKFDASTLSFVTPGIEQYTTMIKVYPTVSEPGGKSLSTVNTGSGFFISNSGHIATNYHVVEQMTTITVRFSLGDVTIEKKATVISTDKNNDIAILKIDEDVLPKSIPYSLSTSNMDVASSVFTLGYPLSDIMGDEVKFTDGKISSQSGYRGDASNYQITVPIQPGSSGGPLFDMDGNIIGITTSGIDKSLADNANYAVKSIYLNVLMQMEGLGVANSNYNSSNLSDLTLVEKIKILKDYTVFITGQ